MRRWIAPGACRCNPDLSVPGHPEVFVAGDLATVSQADGTPVPGIAPAAKQMGTHVARMLLARLAGGNDAAPFIYADYGNLATIGRMAAVVDLRGLQLLGPAGLVVLAGRARVLPDRLSQPVSVLLNWALAYWTYQRGARIVLEQNTATHGPPGARRRFATVCMTCASRAEGTSIALKASQTFVRLQ